MMREKSTYLLCALIRAFLQWWPFRFGKSTVWNLLVRRHVVWRTLPIVAVTRFGARLDGSLPDVIHSYLYFFGVWEPGITRVFSLHLRPGDTVIDIGANVGAHTMLAAHLVGPGGRVHAIEASPTIYRKLQHNLQLNECGQVTPYNVAATDRPSRVTVFLHESSNLGGTTIIATEAIQRAAEREVQVDGLPLGGILPLAEIRAARLIKIDVEGAEWPVLQGILPLLPELHDDCLILLEVSSQALAQFGASVADVIALFQAAGWGSAEVVNTYLPEFYFRPLRHALLANARGDAPILDLVFARPAARERLLASDRAV